MPTPERPLWLQTAQTQAAQKAAVLGLPSQKLEGWKYTSLKNVDLSRFTVGCQNSGFRVDGQALKDFADADHCMYFCDGYLVSAQSKAARADGAVVLPLSAALAGNTRLVETARFFLDREPNAQLGAVGLLNKAHFQDGAFIHIKGEGTHRIALVHYYDASTTPTLVCPRYVIYVSGSAVVEVVEVHISLAPAERLITSATDIVLDHDTRARYAQIFMPGAQDSFFSDTQVRLSENAELQLANLSFGGRLIRNELDCGLLKPGASARFFSAFAATASQHIDNSSFIRHVEGHTKSEQTVKGVASGSSRGVFTGRLLIEQDAQKSDASQLNQSLLLSPHAEVDSRPQLEVFADDVKAAHGASVGDLSTDEIFYLMSRGIPAAEARDMLGRAYVSSVSDGVESPYLKRILNRYIRAIGPEYFEASGGGNDVKSYSL